MSLATGLSGGGLFLGALDLVASLELVRQIRVSFFDAAPGWPAFDARTREGKIAAVVAKATVVILVTVAMLLSL